MELHSAFEKEILNMTPLEQTDSDTESIITKGSQQKNIGDSDMDSLIESEDDDNGSLAKSRLRLFPSDDEGTSDEDSSGIESRTLSDSDNDDDDDSNAEGGMTDDDLDDDRHEGCHKGPSVAEIRKRKMEDPRRLHPELWFNEIGETNDGPVCRCSSVDKQRGIRHGVYPGETAIKLCDPLTNNSDKVHHYWITVTPHTNFMTSNPSVIHAEGKDYTFEGFSMFSHHPLEKVPLCSVIRFNIEYTLHIVSQPIPESFCMKDLDLFSKFLFYQVLELADWNFNGNIDDSCQRYHFMPRFVHRSTHKYDSKKCHELLAMNHVLSHIISSAQPLVQLNHFDLSEEKWEEYSKSCMNFIVMNPAKKPGAIRVDNLRFSKADKDESSKGKEYPNIIHHSIRPVQMSFAGDPKYQKLLRTHNKLRNLISNTPAPSRKNQDKLVKLKIELEKMRLKSSMRRDTVVEISSKGMIKTGLKSDICQHALLLPVIVHHVRYHQCLHSLDKKVGYVFKNRALLQLALTHPSYYLNFGLNPDHARNSLTNCGVKKPRYGDWKVRHLHTRKKGITQLIRVMSNLGKMEEHQSMIRHNERLEFLGDAVLELICSAHLYFMLPCKSEGALAMYRSALVQNKHLAQLAQKLGLSDFMQYSHGPDLCLEEDLKHAMANCFEAILGAIYLEGGLKPATELFTKLTFDDEELRDVWTNLPKHPLQARQPDGDRHLIASSELLQKLQEFEQMSGIEFTHISLLARAFTHAQVGYNNLTLGSNQRMEFLGDSVLQFVVSVYLFRHFPEHHEGHLTLLRSSLVNHRVQAKLSRELGLDKLINFGAKVEMKVFREKLLADILEAFVAALYVDKGLKHVEVLCRVCLFPRLEEFIINQDWMDAKSQLQQCCLTSREEGKTPDLPQYKILQNKGPAHHKHYAVAVYLKNRRLGSGAGKSIQQAEMAAAKDALASHYFPELARQKRLLDRKHQGKRRNYWNKVPRSESEKQNQEHEEFVPQWEEMESFKSQDEHNAVEKQHGNGKANENWEMETNDDRENWEEEFSSGDNKGFDKRRISKEENTIGQENLEKQSCQEAQVNCGEMWDSENDNLMGTEEGEKYDPRENWKDDLNNAKEDWEEEEINSIEMWDEERDGRESWENEKTELHLQENWEEELIDKMKN
ncbi:ribonuclease 3-like isoform X2 [Acropora palmata]